MDRRTRLRGGFGVALTLAVATAVAACGSSSSSGSPGSDGGSPGSSSSAPITIAFIGSLQSAQYSFPEASDAVSAYVAATNAAGGVNGHQLKLTSCNDNADPNEAAVCARQAQTDGAVAVIGGISTQGDQITTTLQKEGIVYTGMRPLAPGDYTSTISFPLVGGGASSGAGLGIYAAKELGCASVYAVTSNIPTSVAVEQAFVSAYKSTDPSGTSNEQTTPVTVADYSPIAASVASKNPDCVYLGVTNAEVAKAFPALKTALPNAKFLTAAANLSPDVITALGSQLDGIYMGDAQLPESDTSNATVKKFGEQMATYEPKAGVDSIALSSWLGADVLVNDVIKNLSGDITAAAVLAAYNKLGTVDTGGVTGDFSYQNPPANPKLPRQFNRTYIVYTLKGGKPDVTSAKFEDATDAIKAGAGS